jgi:imidazolonepropionase-like amidohydrolase
VMTPIEQLQAATITAARLMKQEAHIGRIVPGAYADVLMLDQNPLDDIGVMADLPNHLVMLMQSGKLVISTPGAKA